MNVGLTLLFKTPDMMVDNLAELLNFVYNLADCFTTHASRLLCFQISAITLSLSLFLSEVLKPMASEGTQTQVAIKCVEKIT